MFGYITVCEPELKMKDVRRYKAYYCGLCHMLKKQYGFIGQMTLTYDMTFAIILLTSLYENDTRQLSCRCKVHPVKKQNLLENEITAYAADMNILLSYFHLKDDWKDEKKIASLTGIHLLRRKVRRLINHYPRQSKSIRRSLEKLDKYEKANCQEPDIVAGCFGRLMEELFIWKHDQWEPYLRRLGFFMGKFIYLMDAYEDIEKDKKDGNYNPLMKTFESPDYEEKMQEMLCMMIAEASAQFEYLPCVHEVDILRNILYDGVWNRYKKTKCNEGTQKGKINDKKSI